MNALYDATKFKKPDIIVYMDTPPEVAFERIVRTRKPSFYECGLDCFLWKDLEQAKKDYENNVFSMERLKSYYLDFQSRLSSGYNAIFENKSNVLRIDPKTDISECVEYITVFLQK